MAEQYRVSGQAQQQETEALEQVELAVQGQQLDQGLAQEADDLLAEIDGLLEENAEEFVKSFVQKGGQ